MIYLFSGSDHVLGSATAGADWRAFWRCLKWSKSNFNIQPGRIQKQFLFELGVWVLALLNGMISDDSYNI